MHFELRLPDGSDAYNNPVDPWTSLRTAYARPGLWADGTVDAAMRDWWVYAGAVYGTGYVGFPSVRDAIGSNVQYRANGFNVAAVQYLGNGAATYDATTYTTGALTHLYGAPGAAWIRTWWYKKWRLIGSYNSYLGFPTGGDNGTIQFFQGGCIKVVGTTATASPFGGASCS